jgi:hypothetical protein
MAKPFANSDGNSANIKLVLSDTNGNDILQSKKFLI